LRHGKTEASIYAYVAIPQERDKLMALLEKAYSEHSPYLTNLKVHPMYDPLRSDPRFQKLLHRMGLAPSE